ncbi:vitellogenin [Penaeus vannamei]|uniref:Vitellogenin n=1 Tax=Penaeus vannamei TaxID=6689 RepID=A0A3R7MLF7_PENVA|nr:vitellogenin [Penaeus vannamei]
MQQKYEIETEGEKVIVVKEKNHHHCQQRYPHRSYTCTMAEGSPANPGIHVTVQAGNRQWHLHRHHVSGQEHRSTAIGIYKYVEASQDSTLRFISESSDTSAISAIPSGEMQVESLLYNHQTMKDPQLAPELDELMKGICDKTKDTVEAEAAALVAKALHLLRRVPETVVVETAQKVRQGHYCSDSARLESIFLDAVAFLHESGAVKVMVQNREWTSNRGRLALYTAALYLIPRPSIEAVKALTPLFESPRPVPSVLLAAASMINHYCLHTPACHQKAPVARIAEILATRVQSHCSPSAGAEGEEVPLAFFKAIGNMGVATPAVTRAAVQCIEEEGLETSIRVAAAQAFRQANCFRPAVEKLVDIAVRPAFDTEVRIASYLAAVRCAEQEHLEKIIEKISKEENTQVRGFVLGHLINIQEVAAPTKKTSGPPCQRCHPYRLREGLQEILSTYRYGLLCPALGMGAALESNIIIYAPGSFIPRAVNLNMRATVDETPMDIAEIDVAQSLKGVTADTLIETFFSFFENSLEHMKDLNLNTARTAQLSMDYSLPTIQGTPLKLNLAATAVAGLKMEGNVNIGQILSDLGNSHTGIKVFPGLSVQATGFVGLSAALQGGNRDAEHHL